jgi:hypothetical protein
MRRAVIRRAFAARPARCACVPTPPAGIRVVAWRAEKIGSSGGSARGTVTQRIHSVVVARAWTACRRTRVAGAESAKPRWTRTGASKDLRPSHPGLLRCRDAIPGPFLTSGARETRMSQKIDLTPTYLTPTYLTPTYLEPRLELRRYGFRGNQPLQPLSVLLPRFMVRPGRLTLTAGRGQSRSRPDSLPSAAPVVAASRRQPNR